MGIILKILQPAKLKYLLSEHMLFFCAVAVPEETADTILLLGDFDENPFRKHPNADLALEME